MFEKLIGDLLSNSMDLEVIVESELVSKRLKQLVLGHRSVVSERDISTLDYNLSRLAVQEQGLKVIDDFFYPYLMSDRFDPSLVEKSLGLVRSFYDIYSDSEVLQAINEYLEKNDEFHSAELLFKQSTDLIVDSGEHQRLPRAFTRLLIKDLDIKQNHAFMETDLEEMPPFFREQVQSAGSKVYSSPALKWTNEIEIYDHEWSKGLKFESFSDPIAEVRWSLNQLRNNQTLNIFYPPNSGYESLLYVYQKEFFKEQIFFLESGEQLEVKQILRQLRSSLSRISSKYDDQTSGNHIRFKKFESKKTSFKEFLESFILKSQISNDTLNFISEVSTNLNESFTLEPENWLSLLEKKHIKDSQRSKSIKTRYNFYKYGEPPKNQESDTIVLGWGDEIFKRQIQNWIPAQLAYKLENDLGVHSKSLFKTKAHSLISYLPKESSIITATYAKINLKGESRHQGLLKTLLDDNNSKLKKSERSYNILANIKSEESAKKDKTIKLSASSLNSYYTCPYKYYLEKNVGLRKEEAPDYSISPRDEGSLMHKAMEELGSDRPIGLEEFKKSIESNFIESDEFDVWRSSQAKDLVDRLWPFFKSESDYLQQSGVKPRFVEKEFTFYVDLKTKSLSLEQSDESIIIRGTVDRIDEDEQANLILYDYKRSGSGSYVVSSYTESSPLNPQAFIYYLAAKLGCFGEYSAILGFQFINLTLRKREKGFLFKELLAGSNLVLEKTGAIDKAKFDTKIDLFKDRMFNLIQSIAEERFEAEPVKSDECLKCDWRGICKKTPTFI